MEEFLLKLKQRKLVQWALAYLAAAFALLQGVDIVATRFGWPIVVERGLIVAFCIGFFVVLLLAWYHGEQGRQRVSGTELLIIALVLAVGGGLLWQFSRIPQAVKKSASTTVSTASLKHMDNVAKAPSVSAFAGNISIAVMPFANDSGDPNQRYFSDGLSEDLIIALTQYPTLAVIGRESSFRLRGTSLDSIQIGAKLGVANLLEGSVSHVGDEVRVRAELVSTANGRTLWSDRYDRPYRNLFALQDEITKAVAAALKAKLLGSGNSGAVVQSERPPSGSLAAYNAFLEGNFYLGQYTEAAVKKAIDAYRKAIAADPKYAAAYAQLGFAWSILGGRFLGGAALAHAVANVRSAVHTAIGLNPDLAAAYVAQGRLLELTLDWRGAEAAFRHAVMLDPASVDARQWLADSLARLGRLKEAIRLGREAVAANPLDARSYGALAVHLIGAGQLEAATKATERAISLQPTAGNMHAWLAAVEVLDGNPKAALQIARVEPRPDWRTWALVLAYQAAGDEARADRALQQYIAMAANLAAYQVAELYAYRGDPDNVFAWLDRAWRQRDPGVGDVLFDPFLRRYKNDPRFAAFCRKVGLPVPGSPVTAASGNTP